MKKIIYFPNPVNSERLASIITDKEVSELIADGVFEKKTKYVVKEYNTQSQDLEYLISLLRLEFLKFDNAKKPTDVIVDEDYIQSYYLEKIRSLRKDVLNTLDVLQMRAWAKDRLDIGKEIEEDKDILRNLPDTVNVKNIKTLRDFEFLIPGSLLVDYNDKYKDRFNQQA